MPSNPSPFIMGDTPLGFVGPTLGDPQDRDKQEAVAQLRRLAGYPDPDPYASFDPNAMAQSEFAPQFSALDAAIKEQQNRYNTSNADLAKMFESLAQSTLGRTGDVKNLYDSSGKQMGQNYMNAADNTTRNFGESANKLTELMQRLGIQQAAPSVFAQSQNELGKALADLAGRSQNNVDTNTALGRNEISYLGRTADTNRLAGKNAQADLLRQFQALQAQNAQKRAELISGQQSAANQYGLSISKMKQGDASSQMDQAKLELEKAKFGHQVANDEFTNSLKAQDSQYNTKDPSAALSNRAYEMFGGDATAASTATLGIIQAYQNTGGTSLPAMLAEIDNLTTSDPLTRDRYKQLALGFWLGISGK